MANNVESASPNEVPVIDLSAADVEIVEQIAMACSEFGFFQVTSHGISAELVDEYSEACRKYFALPHDVKLQWKRNESNARGFFDDELTKQRRDWKEALDFGVPGTRDWSTNDEADDNQTLDGWNQLPSDEVLPGFRSTVTKYFDACAGLSDRIAKIMAMGLGQDIDCDMVEQLREKHTSYLRVNYYPPCTELADDGSKPLGISPHKDAGFLTVLLQDDDCHSLQVWKDETWITVKPVRGALTINTGDMAQVWSNGRYKAPLHRVLTNDSKERYSAPFFYNPSYKCLVKPLELEGEGEKTPIYHPVLWGYFRAVRFAGDLTDLGVEIQIEDFLLDNKNDTAHVDKQHKFEQQADFNLPFSVTKYRPLLTSA